MMDRCLRVTRKDVLGATVDHPHVEYNYYVI